MQTLIQQGYSLVKRKRFQEADEVFTQAAAARPEAEAPLQGLVHVARAKKDFKLLISRLDRLLKQFPNNLSARITKAQVQALQGKLGELEALRQQIGAWLTETEHSPISLDAGNKLLLAIQYACVGRQRITHLDKLRSVVNHAIQTQPANVVKLRLLSANICFALGDYPRLSVMVDQLKAIAARDQKLDSLLRVLEKYHAPGFPDFSAPKIFGIGLSKTATSSLDSALNQLGFHAIHWQNPHTQMLFSPQDFLLFDAFSDISVSYQFETLYYTFPNARFIYTTRALDRWKHSVALHYQRRRNIRSPTELCAQSATQRFDGTAGPIEVSLYGRYPTWEAAYLAYDQRVRSFFKDKPAECFLELGICDGEGWEKLCRFLNRPVPASPFPKQNQSPRPDSDRFTDRL